VTALTAAPARRGVAPARAVLRRARHGGFRVEIDASLRAALAG